MRVALLIDRWDPRRGGAEQALLALAEELGTAGDEPLAVGREAAPDLPLPFHRVRTGGWTRGARERRLAAALLEEAQALGADVTLGVRHLPRVDVYWPHGGCHRETLRCLGKRPGGRHRAFVELEDELFARGGVRRVLCVSDLVRDEYLRHYPASADRLVVVPNGVDLERFHPREREAAAARLAPERAPRPWLAFAGQDGERKGLDRLLAALADLRAEPWTLVVCGLRRARPWQRLAGRLGLADRVRFAGHVPPERFAAGADLLVLPARREPCGLVVLEALACGTPVVVTDAVGAADAVTNAEAGSVVASRSCEEELREALHQWIARLRSTPPDRSLVRSGVEQRGRGAWLGRVSREVQRSVSSS